MNEGIIIFTDGSSRGNPGPGGFGAIVALPDEVIELGGREDDTTNNRMELSAAIEALRFVSHLNTKVPATIFSDSSYVINGVTKWVHGWKKNGWQTKSEDEVLNRDLWEELDALASQIKPTWRYVAGHAGHGGNERCDEIATSFADNAPTALYRGPRVAYRVSLAHPVAGVGGSSSKGKSRSGTAYSYVSAIGGVIQTHKTWSECESRVKGAKGARFKKALSLAEERDIIGEFSKK